MTTLTIVEDLDVFEQASVSILSRLVVFEVYTLSLERVEELFGDRIVVAACPVACNQRCRLIRGKKLPNDIACILASSI